MYTRIHVCIRQCWGCAMTKLFVNFTVKWNIKWNTNIKHHMSKAVTPRGSRTESRLQFDPHGHTHTCSEMCRTQQSCLLNSEGGNFHLAFASFIKVFFIEKPFRHSPGQLMLTSTSLNFRPVFSIPTTYYAALKLSLRFTSLRGAH